MLLLVDIDGDGLCELVTGNSDRTLHLYRWESHKGIETGVSVDKNGMSPSCTVSITGQKSFTKFLGLFRYQLS